MATAKKAKFKPKKKAPAKKSAISKKAAPTRKKPAVKKTAAKKAAPKKAPAKKSAVKKVATKKTAPPSPVAKQVVVKQPAIQQPAASQPAAPRKKLPPVVLSAVAVAPRGIPHSNAAAAAATPDHSPLPSEDPVGVVTHYFSHLSVAVVELDTGSLEVGDTVRFIGHTTDHRQKVTSLEVKHQSVTEVGRRQAFGMKVQAHVREHDVVYKVSEF